MTGISVSGAKDMRSGKGEVMRAPRPLLGGSASRRAESLFYHTARSIEELDRASASSGSAACRAHEQLAALHLETATRIRRNDLCDIVAEWVD